MGKKSSSDSVETSLLRGQKKMFFSHQSIHPASFNIPRRARQWKDNTQALTTLYQPYSNVNCVWQGSQCLIHNIIHLFFSITATAKKSKEGLGAGMEWAKINCDISLLPVDDKWQHICHLSGIVSVCHIDFTSDGQMLLKKRPSNRWALYFTCFNV